MNDKRGRGEFAEWVAASPRDQSGRLLPLTHITSGIAARNILKMGRVLPRPCDVMDDNVSYLFYGRPAYRLAEGDVVKRESACPFCFIFDAALIQRAREIFAFDTGACNNRLYNHILHSGFSYRDFSLGLEVFLPGQLIRSVFCNTMNYLNGDRSLVGDVADLTAPHQFEARAYLDLIKSPGRNEADDRVCSIEVVFAEAISVSSALIAIVVPHTLSCSDDLAPWLADFPLKNIDIVPYNFVPGRPPEHYHTLLEIATFQYYKKKTTVLDDD